MFRLFLSLAFITFTNICLSDARETPADVSAEELSAVDRLKADPNDLEALNDYFGEEINGAYDLINEEKFEEAEAKLKAAGEFVSSLEPTEEDVKKLKLRFPLYRRNAELRIEVARTPLEELQENWETKADDPTSFKKILLKYSLQISPFTRKEPEKAEEMIVDAKAYFDTVNERDPENKKLAKLMTSAEATFKSLQRRVDTEKTHRGLIGQDSPPVNTGIQTWANGAPLSNDDLQGKVVMLDFWAVWCGPCIKSFPHLREWHAKYGDQGFEIVGITRLYNYKWDEKTQKAVKVKKEEQEVTPEEEQSMLEHFAELHELTHRFAVLDEERTLSKHFAANYIPTVALIDRKGVIRLIRAGNSDENTHDISQMIEKLIQE